MLKEKLNVLCTVKRGLGFVYQEQKVSEIRTYLVMHKKWCKNWVLCWQDTQRNGGLLTFALLLYIYALTHMRACQCTHYRADTISVSFVHLSFEREKCRKKSSSFLQRPLLQVVENVGWKAQKSRAFSFK